MKVVRTTPIYVVVTYILTFTTKVSMYVYAIDQAGVRTYV